VETMEALLIQPMMAAHLHELRTRQASTTGHPRPPRRRPYTRLLALAALIAGGFALVS
jgi:ferric-dicitrate binding protein FerR (iron transport regulator)